MHNISSGLTLTFNFTWTILLTTSLGPILHQFRSRAGQEMLLGYSKCDSRTDIVIQKKITNKKTIIYYQPIGKMLRNNFGAEPALMAAKDSWYYRSYTNEIKSAQEVFVLRHP